jgi:sugar phosphate isomerase/epimerase
MIKSFFSLILLYSFFAAQAQNSDPGRDWKLGVQMWTFNKYTFVEGLAKADSCGFRYIEAYPGQQLGGNFKGEIGAGMPVEERKELKDYLSKKGFVLWAFGVVDGTDDAKTDKDWINVFEFAHDMGIQEITVMPTSSQLDLVNTLSGKYHIRAAIHDEPGVNAYDHPDSVLRAIRNRPNLGACVDIGNWVRNGVDIVDCLQKQLHGRVFSLHLKDVQKAGSTHAPDVLLGSGACNLPGIFSELKKEGFKGFFSLEVESEGIPKIKDLKTDINYFNAQARSLSRQL